MYVHTYIHMHVDTHVCMHVFASACQLSLNIVMLMRNDASFAHYVNELLALNSRVLLEPPLLSVSC